MIAQVGLGEYGAIQIMAGNRATQQGGKEGVGLHAAVDRNKKLSHVVVCHALTEIMKRHLVRAAPRAVGIKNFVLAPEVADDVHCCVVMRVARLGRYDAQLHVELTDAECAAWLVFKPQLERKVYKIACSVFIKVSSSAHRCQ